MGCGAGKVTPAESIRSDNKTATRRGNGTNQDIEEADGPPGVTEEIVSVSTQPQSRMYRRPQLHPKHVPLLNRFESDKVEVSPISPKSRNKSIKSPSPFLIPTLNLRPASPFITGNLKNYREASASQQDFLKMLDKKIAEGVDYKEK